MSSVDFTNVPEKVDEKDRHVAAAALALRHSADEATEDDEPALVYDVLLVTDNVVDLAKGPMRKLGVRVITSGAFLDEVYAAEPDAAERAIQQAVKDLKNPPYTVAELLFALKAGGAKELVTGLSTRWAVIPTKHDHPAKGKGREPTKG